MTAMDTIRRGLHTEQTPGDDSRTRFEPKVDVFVCVAARCLEPTPRQRNDPEDRDRTRTRGWSVGGL